MGVVKMVPSRFPGEVWHLIALSCSSISDLLQLALTCQATGRSILATPATSPSSVVATFLLQQLDHAAPPLSPTSLPSVKHILAFIQKYQDTAEEDVLAKLCYVPYHFPFSDAVKEAAMLPLIISNRLDVFRLLVSKFNLSPTLSINGMTLLAKDPSKLDMLASLAGRESYLIMLIKAVEGRNYAGAELLLQYLDNEECYKSIKRDLEVAISEALETPDLDVNAMMPLLAFAEKYHIFGQQQGLITQPTANWLTNSFLDDVLESLESKLNATIVQNMTRFGDLSEGGWIRRNIQRWFRYHSPPISTIQPSNPQASNQISNVSESNQWAETLTEISKTATSTLARAARDGNLEAVELCNRNSKSAFNTAVMHAALNNYEDVVRSLFIKGASYTHALLGRLVREATNGNAKIVLNCLKLMNMPALKVLDDSYNAVVVFTKEAFMGACKSGVVECVLHLNSYGFSNEPWLTEALAVASEVEMAKHLVSIGAKITADALLNAIKNSNMELVLLYLSTPTFAKSLGKESDYVIESILAGACRTKKLSFLRLMLNQGLHPDTKKLWCVYEVAAEVDRELAKEWFNSSVAVSRESRTALGTSDSDERTPRHGFLHEIIHHRSRDHCKIVSGLLAAGDVKNAEMWAKRNRISMSLLAAMKRMAQQPPKPPKPAKPSNAFSMVKNTAVGTVTRRKHISSIPDENGKTESEIQQLISSDTHGCVLEYAITHSSCWFVRDLVWAGEPVSYCGNRVFAKLCARDQSVEMMNRFLGCWLRRPVNPSAREEGTVKVDPYDGVRVACYLGKLDHLREVIFQHGVIVGEAQWHPDSSFKHSDAAVMLEPGYFDVLHQYVNVPGAIMAAVRGNYLAVLRFLFEDCKLVLPRRTGHKSPEALRLAVMLQNAEMAKLLLQQGASTSASLPLLYFALCSHDMELFELSFKEKAFLNGRSFAQRTEKQKDLLNDYECFAIEVSEERHLYQPESGFAPLAKAALMGDFATVQRLIEAGADVNESDEQALMVATWKENKKLVDLLKNAGATSTGEYRGRLLLAIDWNRLNDVKEVFDDFKEKRRILGITSESANPLLAYGNGEAIRRATRLNCPQILRYLLDQPGARTDWCEYEALLYASRRHYTECVRLLLAHRNIPTERKTTALFSLDFSRWDSHAIAGELIKAGAEKSWKGSEDIIVEQVTPEGSRFSRQKEKPEKSSP